jgi:HEAT repeat protein
LRAIRALPQFCTAQLPHCKDDSDAAMSPVRTAVRDVINSVAPTDRDGRSLLRLRAGIEALGAVGSGEQSDVDTLVAFLGHPSRDIRYATARALRDLCIQTAITPLRNRYDEETVPQVSLAISAALGDLAQCSQ